MKRPSLAALLWLLALRPTAGAETADGATTNPLQKVIQLMTDLQGKVIADGEKDQKSYNDFVEWCSKTSSAKQQEVKEGTSKMEELQAKIEKAASDAKEASTQISALSASISTNEADLKALNLLRDKEAEDFKALDTELTSTIDTLIRARRVLQEEVAKGNKASFLQQPTKGMLIFNAALEQLVTAAVFASEDDRDKLEALLQQRQQQQQGDAGAEEPKQQLVPSNDVLEALQDLQEKTEQAQADARKKETNERHNYALIKQDFESNIKTRSSDLEESKKALARAKEVRAQSEKELTSCKADLTADKKVLEETKRDCMERASQFEDKQRTRAAELDALARAKKIIQDGSSGAGQQAYSFMQVKSKARAVSPAALAAVARVVRELHHLAKSTRSLTLAQLATHASAAVRGGGGGPADPFVKVRGLIENMIMKLEKEAKEEASRKEFCDREMSRTTKSKDEKTDLVQELSGRLESIAADVAQLQEELKTLSTEMAEASHLQADMNKIRVEEHSTFVTAKADVQEGLSAVQRALSILRDYYGGSAASGTSLMQEDAADEDGTSLMQEDMGESMAARAQQRTQEKAATAGAGKSIIGLLEVVESDFATELTEIQTTEQAAVEEHAELTQANNVMTAKQEVEVKNKNDEVTKLRKAAAEITSDRTESQQELDAILEYDRQLQSQCGPKKETFEDRVAKRKQEVQGLEDALQELESASR